MASSPRSAQTRGFTLVELLTAMTVFLIMLGIFGSILNSVYKAWESARRETEIAQNARAILGLIEKDLTPAVVSNLMQFGVNPNIDPNLPSEKLVDNSDRIFFYSPISTSSGPVLSQVGWYLSKSKSNPEQFNELRRFCKNAPTSTTPPSSSAAAAAIYWLQSSSDKPSDLTTSSRVVSERVLGFWVECLDRHESNIPYLFASVPTTDPLRFNSAARFQMSPAATKFQNNLTFQYCGPSTLQAQSMPAAVRITILLTDEATLIKHRGNIDPPPGMNAPDANVPPQSVEAEVAGYRNKLAKKGIQAAVYSTVIKMSRVQSQ